MQTKRSDITTLFFFLLAAGRCFLSRPAVFLQKSLQKVLTILLWAGIIINVARVRQTKTSLWGISSAGRALAWHARGHRFDPGILHQSNAKRTQCHHSNGRQCVRFVLQTSTSCITHNKKARTFPLQSVRVFLCLYLVRGTKHRENFAKIFRLFAGAPAAMPYKKITGWCKTPRASDVLGRAAKAPCSLPKGRDLS